MLYKLIEKKQNVKSFKEIFEFHSPYKIYDICMFDDIFFASTENGIMSLSSNETLISNGDLVRFGNFNSSLAVHPSSLSSSVHGIFVCEAGGRVVRFIEQQSGWTEQLNRDHEVSEWSKLPMNGDTGIIAQDNQVLWVSSIKSQVFRYSNAETEVLAGNGRQGYSVGTNSLRCSFSYPQGLCMSNGIVYVCDTGNRCIRMIRNNTVEFLCGYPKEDFLIKPTKILPSINSYKMQKTLPIGLSQSYPHLLVLDDGKVKTVTKVEEKAVSSVLYNNAIADVVSIAESPNGLLILEKYAES